jgi:predicted double-glycine peptidase
MKTQGLYHQVASKRMAAGELARQARRTALCPRAAYEKGIEAERLAMEAEDLSDHSKANEEVMENTNKLLHYMAVSKHKSRYRSLAITALEEVICWLQRENGDAEPEREFTEVKAPKPKILKS